MDLGKAIRAARKAKGMTQEQLGDRFGISKAAVAQWESGKNVPDQRKLGELARVLDLDPGVAIGLNQAPAVAPPPLVTEVIPAPNAPLPPHRQDMPRDVPVLGTSLGGDGNGEFHFNGEVIDYVRRPPRLIGRKDVFVLYVQGSSMSPWREPGGMVYLERNRPPRPGDYVVIELTGDPTDEAKPALLKRLVATSPSKIKLKQYNPAKEFDVERASVRALFRVMDWDELMGV